MSQFELPIGFGLPSGSMEVLKERDETKLTCKELLGVLGKEQQVSRRAGHPPVGAKPAGPKKGFKVAVVAVGVLLLLAACARGPGGALESQTVVLDLDSGSFRADGPDIMSQDFEIPEITAEVVTDGTVTAYFDRGTDGKYWIALPFAYQAPDKSAALLTYRYREGSLSLLVVSPSAATRAQVVAVVRQSKVKVIVTD